MSEGSLDSLNRRAEVLGRVRVMLNKKLKEVVWNNGRIIS
jgi:hypothetical protein